MQSQSKSIKQEFSIYAIIVGRGLAVMSYPLGLLVQEVYATFYGDSTSEDLLTIAYPSTSSNSKVIKQDNSTLSILHKDNPTQTPIQPPTSLPNR